jgi:hypothetical protein
VLYDVKNLFFCVLGSWRKWNTAVDWRKHHEVARKQKCWYKTLALWFVGSNPALPTNFLFHITYIFALKYSALFKNQLKTNMKIPETIKTKMSDYYTFGDHTKIKRLGIQKKKPFSLVTIGKAFKEGECHDDLLDLIDEFYNLKIKKYGK